MAAPDLHQDLKGMWPMTDESREKIVQRIASNLAAISFFTAASSEAGAPSPAARLDDEAAREHALVIEKEAFVLADAKFHAEGPGASESAAVMAYAKHAGDAMIALLKAKIVPSVSAGAAAPKEVEAEVPAEVALDLSGDGKREFLEKARAEELLKPMLAGKPNKFTKVKLSTKSFKPEACAAAVEALRNAAETLKHADLSDIIAGQPEDEALAVLAEIGGSLQGAQLRYLDISNNALGEKGLRAFAAGLTSQHSLEELFFCNNGISAAAGEAIVELLPIENAATLKTLHFHNNMSGDDGAKALSELVKACAAAGLEDFRFSSTRVGTEGGVSLAEALAQGSSLRKMDMRDNMFGEEGGAAIAAAIENNPHLEELYLGDTGLGNEGVASVVKALAANCKGLRVLDLGGNELTPEGASELVTALESLPSLRWLVLSENELGDEGASIVAAGVARSNKELEELDLVTNEIGDKGALAAAEAACQLPALRQLCLNGNAISKATIEQIKSTLSDGCTRGVDVLGPLDENDDGEDEEED